jgi:hypothetical protein
MYFLPHFMQKLYKDSFFKRFESLVDESSLLFLQQKLLKDSNLRFLSPLLAVEAERKEGSNERVDDLILTNFGKQFASEVRGANGQY